MQNTAQYQVFETNRWVTVTRKSFDGNWKGDLVAEMKEEYKKFLKQKAYDESKLLAYH